MGYNNTTVKILGNCVTVARQTLTLFVGVRIPIPQPERVHQKDAPFFYALFIRVSEQKCPQNLRGDFIDENSLFPPFQWM